MSFVTPEKITIAQVKQTTTVVRNAVATFESTPSTPTFARIAVNACKERRTERPVEPVHRRILDPDAAIETFMNFIFGICDVAPARNFPLAKSIPIFFSK
jgi:hypothetical protein